MPLGGARCPSSPAGLSLRRLSASSAAAVAAHEKHAQALTTGRVHDSRTSSEFLPYNLHFKPNAHWRSLSLQLRFMPDPPTLNIYGTHRMNKSDNLDLTCRFVQASSSFFRPSPVQSMRGRQRLVWSNPPVSARLSTSDCSGSGLFCTTLTITNATVNETGQYRCYYKDLKVEDGKTAAAVYVFVHDSKVPFVPSEKEYEVVFIREGERVVIPCRGSVENLNVTLNTVVKLKDNREKNAPKRRDSSIRETRFLFKVTPTGTTGNVDLD
ncbi:hypothetical protein CCH79_00011188 [Gambusia affinis]|uniref:Ig-like domain-containing protein n=1 Tax=Gambusia affinis TaxID=33528 RepID=A0A315URR3_GAMAF|nr:hypothetical protein CCH79_00011188 [Gambusia affinis]